VVGQFDDLGTIPRTLNPAAPYGKRRVRNAFPQRALGPADPSLGEEKLVVS